MLFKHTHQQKHSKKTQANISLLVLFILIVTSLLGLMATTMLRHMQQSHLLFEHGQQAHYLARGGIEYGLVSVNTNHRWRQQTYQETWRNVSINARHNNEIRGRTWWPLDDCTAQNAFVFSGWQSLVLPLFVGDDSRVSTVRNIEIIPLQANDIALGLSIDDNTVFQQELYATWSLEENSISVFLEWKTLDLTQWKHYLIMTALDQEIQFCLSHQWQGDIASDRVTIKSTGQHGLTSVSLVAKKYQPLPDYIYNLSIIR